jgi:hypothetical protein
MMAFGMIWAARRYMRSMDRKGYERLVERYGEPDHPMVRYARAFLWSDYAGMSRWAPDAVAELRRAGDNHLADRFEIAGQGYMLLLLGRFREHDALLTRLLEQARTEGPPTALNWTLAYLGASASAQGRDAEAWHYFDEAATVAVPPRTNSMTNPVAARASLRRGDRALAFEQLRAFVDELLEHDNLFMAKIAGVEFLTMMARVGRWAAVARMLGYVRAGGAFGDAAPLRTGVAEAAAAVAANIPEVVAAEEAGGAELGDREALLLMRDTLDDLLQEALAQPA